MGSSDRANLSKFGERHRSAQCYDFLVYVYGEEISFAVRSLEINYSNRGGIGSASIVLDNPFDQWVLTTQNIDEDIWRRGDGRYSESAKENIYTRKKIHQNMTFKYSAALGPGTYGNDTSKAQAHNAKIQKLLKEAFPGIVITSGLRSPDDSLTQALYSQKKKISRHVTGEAVDVRPMKDVTGEQISQFLSNQGLRSVLFLDETGPNRSPHATGDHWHFQWINPEKGDSREARISREPVNDELQRKRFMFGPGTCVFSKMDPVRIFIRDPYQAPDAPSRWMPAFTGMIDQKPLVTNFITGESSLTLVCYDVRGAMQSMRVATNPYQWKAGEVQTDPSKNPGSDGSGVIKSGANFVVFDDDAWVFKDFFPKVESEEVTTNTGKKKTVFTHFLANKSFYQAVNTVLTGTLDGTTKEGMGVGWFEVGHEQRFDKKDDNQILSDWDLLCLFGEKRTWWDDSEVNEMGLHTIPGMDGDAFHGKVHWLLPPEDIKDLSSLIEQNFDGLGNLLGSPDWTDRYSLIVQLCNKVDYQFTITGCGDIVLEFPMYDINPATFAPHQAIYVADYHVVSESISDEGGDVLAGLEAISYSADLAKSQVDKNLNSQPAQLNTPDMRAIVYSNILASKYGAKVQNVTFTGIKDIEALKKITLVEFQKRLAEANKLSLDLVFRPFLRPNRPFLYGEEQRQRMGLTIASGISMPVLEEPKSTVSIGCVRLPVSNKGAVQFVHLTGSPHMALSYAYYEQQSNSGIEVLPKDLKNGQVGKGGDE